MSYQKAPLAHLCENSTKTFVGAFSLCSNYIFSQGVAKFEQWDLPGWDHSEHCELYYEDREKGARTPYFCFSFYFTAITDNF